MSLIHIIILVILALVLLWGLNNIFLKTNIIYDRMCEASAVSTETDAASSSKNIIAAKDIPETTASNFTLSVWFYIDNWGNDIGNEKNILFMATNHIAQTLPDFIDATTSFSGISTYTLKNTPTSPTIKNINIALDKYENNLNFAIRSKNNPIIDSTDIYLVDTLGEVGIFYELVDFAFIGGSIVNVGGHNPYEAINLNCVPITGKFHYNFQDVYHEIFLKDSGFLINNSLELTALLGEILKNPNILEKYKNNLKNLQNKNTQEVKNIILKLKEII
jgi:hypothetical protein